MRGKTIVVTGSTSGLGKAVAHKLYRMGANVIMVYRNLNKIQKVLEEIVFEGNGNINLMYCNLASLKSIRELADKIDKEYERIDGLCNLAGMITLKHQLSDDGFELTWATDYLSHFYLTNLLLNKLKSSAPSTVITISGSAHYSASLNLENPELKDCFNGITAAKQAALARAIFALELARRLENTGVTSNTFCSGFTRTNLTGSLAFPLNFFGKIAMLFAHSPEKGTEIVIKLLQEPTKYNGKYFDRITEKEPSTLARSHEAGKKLWSLSEEMISQKISLSL